MIASAAYIQGWFDSKVQTKNYHSVSDGQRSCSIKGEELRNVWVVFLRYHIREYYITYLVAIFVGTKNVYTCHGLSLLACSKSEVASENMNPFRYL